MTDKPADTRTVSLEFDDIVYGLQSIGGISEYWREITGRVARMPDFEVRHRSGTRWGRMRHLRSGCRVFHSSYYRTARGPHTRTVSTVHDLAYELGYVRRRSRAWWHCLEHRSAYFASDALICVSHSTRDDLLRVYPALADRCPIYVVPHGVTLAVEASADRPGRLPSAASPYVLYVGGRGDYKNFDNALLGFAASGMAQQGHALLCTGAAFRREEFERIAHLGLAGAVRSAGQVDRRELAWLYANAHCLLYPSLFEGFGLPLIEAMQMGCPVVASNRSVMPEVAGDAALLVDALDPTAISSALVEAGRPDTRTRLIQRGITRAATYSWDRSASKHASIYRSLG